MVMTDPDGRRGYFKSLRRFCAIVGTGKVSWRSACKIRSGKDIMKELHTRSVAVPNRFTLNEAGHFVPEWGEDIAKVLSHWVSNHEIKKAGETSNDGCSHQVGRKLYLFRRYSGIEWRIAQRDDILSEGRLGYANFEQKSPFRGCGYKFIQ